MLDCIKTETPYLTDKAQYTFVGTRTGASAASVWAVFKNVGSGRLHESNWQMHEEHRIACQRYKKSWF